MKYQSSVMLFLFYKCKRLFGSVKTELMSRALFVWQHINNVKFQSAFLWFGNLKTFLLSLPCDSSSSFYSLLKTFLFAGAWAGSASE